MTAVGSGLFAAGQIAAAVCAGFSVGGPGQKFFEALAGKIGIESVRIALNKGLDRGDAGRIFG
jgi:hypothetical protein